MQNIRGYCGVFLASKGFNYAELESSFWCIPCFQRISSCRTYEDLSAYSLLPKDLIMQNIRGYCGVFLASKGFNYAELESSFWCIPCFQRISSCRTYEDLSVYSLLPKDLIMQNLRASFGVFLASKGFNHAELTRIFRCIPCFQRI